MKKMKEMNEMNEATEIKSKIMKSTSIILKQPR